jgi:hypothetical protein
MTTKSMVSENRETTATMVTAGVAGTTTILTTSLKTEITGNASSAVSTSIENRSTTAVALSALSASPVSGSSTTKPSVTVYEGSGYKLGNSFILALAAYMLAI